MARLAQARLCRTTAECLIFVLGFYVPALAAIPDGARSLPAPALSLPSIESSAGARQSGRTPVESRPQRVNRAPVQLASQETALATGSSVDHFQCYRTSGVCTPDSPQNPGSSCASESVC